MKNHKRAIYRDDIDLLLELETAEITNSREKYFIPCCIPSQMNKKETHLFCVPEKVARGRDRYLYGRIHCGASFEACGPLAKITILQVKRSRSGNQTWYRGSYRVEEVYSHD